MGGPVQAGPTCGGVCTGGGCFVVGGWTPVRQCTIWRALFGGVSKGGGGSLCGTPCMV